MDFYPTMCYLQVEILNLWINYSDKFSRSVHIIDTVALQMIALLIKLCNMLSRDN